LSRSDLRQEVANSLSYIHPKLIDRTDVRRVIYPANILTNLNHLLGCGTAEAFRRYGIGPNHFH